MYPVSRAFQEAIRKPQRETSVSGKLFLSSANGYDIFSFDDESIVQKSLTITDQFNGGKFCYGSVYVSNMSIKLDCSKIEGLDPFNINLTNSHINLEYTITLADGTTENMNLGDYIIDSARSSRRFDILSLYGADHLTKLDIASMEMENATPYEVFSTACGLSYQNTGNTEEFFDDLPNGNVKLTFDTKQIQTARDMVMWVANLTGTFVRTKRGWGEAVPQLVQIPTKYTKGGTAGNFDLEAFKEDNGSIIPANVRISSKFTDTSVRTTTVIMNTKNGQITSHKEWTFAKDTLEGTMELENNPLLTNKTANEVQTILDNIADYTDDLRFCPFEVTFNGNPAIECGDFVYLEPGGGIDDTKYYHYGIVTYSKWVYHGKCEIRCATDMTSERPGGTRTATVMRAAKSLSRAANDSFGIKPKSQLEKRVDALEENDVASILTFKPVPTTRLEFTSPNDLHMTYMNGEVFKAYFSGSYCNLDLGAAEIIIEDRGITLNWENGAKLRLECDSGFVEFTDKYKNTAWFINPTTGEMRIKGRKVLMEGEV